MEVASAAGSVAGALRDREVASVASVAVAPLAHEGFEGLARRSRRKVEAWDDDPEQASILEEAAADGGDFEEVGKMIAGLSHELGRRARATRTIPGRGKSYPSVFAPHLGSSDSTRPASACCTDKHLRRTSLWTHLWFPVHPAHRLEGLCPSGRHPIDRYDG